MALHAILLFKKEFQSQEQIYRNKKWQPFPRIKTIEKNPFSILNKGEVYIILSFVLKTVNAEIHPKTHFPL